MKRLLVLLAALVAIGTVTPASASAAKAEVSDDPLRTLGGDSPLCAEPRTTVTRERCERSGAVERPYPLGRYAFDWHIDTGVTKIMGNISAAIQFAVGTLWQFVLWVANGILLVFQWAFSLDLLGDAMGPVRATLQRLHTTVFGTPWFTAAILLLGLWGLWNGVLRRRTMATVGGLLAALAMMAGALALIANPDATVGSATRAINETKLAILGGVTSGSVRNADASLEDTSEEIFNTIVLRPWCAIQFADVEWCLERPAGSSQIRADQWLQFSEGSKAREAIYKMYEEEDYDVEALFEDQDEISDEERQLLVATLPAAKGVSDTDRSKVAMMEQDHTVIRAVLVLLMMAGVFGWVLLIGWLALQSLLQALLGFLLVLVAPLMLLAPAFGDTGRSAFIEWAKRLLATVVSGAIYALLLALTLTVATLIGDLSSTTTFLAAWLLQMLFLWGVFFKRKEVLGWLSGGTQKPVSTNSAEKVARSELRRKQIERVARPVAGLVGAPMGAFAGGAARTRLHRRGDKDHAVQLLAGEQLAERGRQQLEAKYQAHHARLSTHDEAARKLPEMRRRRDKLDRELQSPKLSNEHRQQLTADRGKLTGQIKALEPKLMPRAEEGVARKFIETADRSLVESGRRFSDQQVAQAVEGIRQDVEGGGSAPAAPEHAWRMQTYRPGLPESELAKLPDTERAELERHVSDDVQRDRALFAALPRSPREDRAPTRRRRKAAKELKADIGKSPVTAAMREERAQRHANHDGGALHNLRARRADGRARKAREQAGVAPVALAKPLPPHQRPASKAPPKSSRAS